jgi:hypothetical protein
MWISPTWMSSWDALKDWSSHHSLTGVYTCNRYVIWVKGIISGR